MGREPKADSLGGRLLATLRRIAPRTMTTQQLAAHLEALPGRVSTSLGTLSDRNLVQRDGAQWQAVRVEVEAQ